MAYNSLIISSAQTQITLSYGANVYNLVTGLQLSVDKTQDVTEIFAIGSNPPIGIKKLNQRFTATLALQTGEYETILDAINASISGGFIASLLDLPPFSLGWSIQMNDLIVPKSIIYSLDNVMASSDGYSVDRNSPETNQSLSLQGTGISRTVLNL